MEHLGKSGATSPNVPSSIHRVRMQTSHCVMCRPTLDIPSHPTRSKNAHNNEAKNILSCQVGTTDHCSHRLQGVRRQAHVQDWCHFIIPTMASARAVMRRSARRLAFALHLSKSSRRPDVRFHCHKGAESEKVRSGADRCPCAFHRIRQADDRFRFGSCDATHNQPFISAAFTDILLSDALQKHVLERRRIADSLLKFSFPFSLDE
jgi:hypothetical protein